MSKSLNLLKMEFVLLSYTILFVFSTVAEAAWVDLYRYTSVKGQDHFYTTNGTGVTGYKIEASIGYISTTQESGTTDLWQLYSPKDDDHLYTINQSEIQSAQPKFAFDGRVGYVYRTAQAETRPVYRVYLEGHDHLYTTDIDEARRLTAAGWVKEGEGKDGIAFYVRTRPPVVPPPPAKNNPPVISSVDPGIELNAKTGDVITFELKANDEKPGLLKWNEIPSTGFEGKLERIAVAGSLFRLRYTAPSCSAQMLNEEFVVEVTDDQGLKASESFRIDMQEDKAATIDQGDTVTLSRTQGQGGAITLSATPSKCEEKWTINGGPSKGSANLNGSGSAAGDSVRLNYTAPSSISFDETVQFNVQLTTSDLQNERISDDSLAVFVNLLAPKVQQVAPSISGNDPISLGSVEAGQSVSNSLVASDGNGDPLSWSVLTQPVRGSVTFNPASGNNSQVTYTSPSDLSSTENYSFVVQVSDSTGRTDNVTFNVTVNPKKVDPNAPEIQGSKFINLGSIDRNLGTIQYVLDASDPDGDELNWFIKTQASAGDRGFG